MKGHRIIGLALAATIGLAAAVSWCLWVWLTFGGAA
jgi:hypothetical protein